MGDDARAEPLEFAQKLEMPAGDPVTSWYGYAIAAQGDLALIAGRNPEGLSQANWVVDAYQRIDGSWVHVQTIESPDPIAPTAQSFFGQSLAMDNALAVIGDTVGLADGASNGAAYVYAWDGNAWVFQQKLISPVPLSYDNYAGWLGISGETVVVAAPTHEIPAGPVFVGLTAVYERDRHGVWSLTQAISEPDITGLFAGELLVFKNDTIVLGSVDQFAVYRPHVLRRNEQGLFAYDLSFPLAVNGTTLQAISFDIAGDEVLMFRSAGGDLASPLSMIGLTRDVDGQPGWSLTTIVQDPYPSELLSDWSGNTLAKRSEGTVLMSVGLQRPYGVGMQPAWRTLAFSLDPSGAWAVQTLQPPPGSDPGSWSVNTIAPDEAGGWFIASLSDAGVAYYAPPSVAAAPPCPGDLNADAIIDADDLAGLLAVFGTACP